MALKNQFVKFDTVTASHIHVLESISFSSGDRLGLNLSNQRLFNVANPQSPQEAATKDYVDTLIMALPGGAAIINEPDHNARLDEFARTMESVVERLRVFDETINVLEARNGELTERVTVLNERINALVVPSQSNVQSQPSIARRFNARVAQPVVMNVDFARVTSFSAMWRAPGEKKWITEQSSEILESSGNTLFVLFYSTGLQGPDEAEVMVVFTTD